MPGWARRGDADDPLDVVLVESQIPHRFHASVIDNVPLRPPGVVGGRNFTNSDYGDLVRSHALASIH